MNTNHQNTSGDFSVRLFGVPKITLHMQPLPHLRSRKGVWLLALLMLRGGRAVERVWLAQTLWPDNEENKALYSLRRTLNDLRQALGKEAWRLYSPTPRTLSVDLQDAFCDVSSFDNAIKQTEETSLEYAVNLYEGALMEDCHEEWVFLERSNREQAFLNGLQRLADRALEAGNPARAVGFLERILAIEPLREEAGRKLMRALSEQGNTPEAIAFYRRLRTLLRERVNTSPAPETIQIFESLRHSLNHVNPSLHRSSPAPPSFLVKGLPRPRTELIGRLQALVDITSHLENNCLVTVTGAAGVGKTRVVIEIAAETAINYAAGAWFVDLAPVQSETQLVPTLIKAIVEQDDPGYTEALIIERINNSDGKSLLIIDNCEHLAGIAVFIDTLLRSCPRLYILATSRHPLYIEGEIRYRIAPLEFAPGAPEPSEDSRLTLKDWQQHYPANFLFVEIARRQNPDFHFTKDNLLDIVRICARLDGIPLAIELAAVQVAHMPIRMIATRLDHHLSTLGGPGIFIPRHQTIQACLDWSYRLLSRQEQTVLQRVSVFAGGWTLEAAEYVCADTASSNSNDDFIAESDVVVLLGALVEKSLLSLDTSYPEARYEILETVRDHAARRLSNPVVFQEKHLHYYALFTQKADMHLSGALQNEWLQRLEDDRENYWLGISRGIATLSLRYAGIKLAGLLSRFCFIKGYWQQTSDCLTKLLTAYPPPEKTEDWEILARAWNGAGVLAWTRGDALEARTCYLKALVAWQTAANQRGEAAVLGNLAMLAVHQQNYDEALQKEEQSLVIRRTLNDTDGIANSLSNLGMIAWYQRDIDKAQNYYSESLQLRRRKEDKHGIATCLNNLGLVATDKNDNVFAATLYSESATLFRSLGDKKNLAETLQGSAEVAYKQQEYEKARDFIEESITLFRELGSLQGYAATLAIKGKLARLRQERGSEAVIFKDQAELHLKLGNHEQCLDCLEVVASAFEALGRISLAHEIRNIITALPKPIFANKKLEQAIAFAAIGCTGLS